MSLIGVLEGYGELCLEKVGVRATPVAQRSCRGDR
jgi:hypothetical protein